MITYSIYKFHYLLFILILYGNGFAIGQQIKSDSILIGQRIIMLTGRGEVSSFDKSGTIQIKQAPNIVAPVARVEGNKVWILSCEHESNHNGQIKYIKGRLPGAKQE